MELKQQLDEADFTVAHQKKEMDMKTSRLQAVEKKYVDLEGEILMLRRLEDDSFAALTKLMETKTNLKHAVEKEKMSLAVKVVELEDQLKQAENTIALQKEEMEKKTAFYDTQESKLLDELKKIQQEKHDRVLELHKARIELRQQKTAIEVLRSKCDELSMTKTGLAANLLQPNMDIYNEPMNLPEACIPQAQNISELLKSLYAYIDEAKAMEQLLKDEIKSLKAERQHAGLTKAQEKLLKAEIEERKNKISKMQEKRRELQNQIAVCQNQLGMYSYHVFDLDNMPSTTGIVIMPLILLGSCAKVTAACIYE